MPVTLTSPIAQSPIAGVRVQHVSIREGKTAAERRVEIAAQAIDSNGDFMPGPPYHLVCTASGGVATQAGVVTQVPALTYDAVANAAAPNGFIRRCTNAIKVAFNLVGTET